jgi:hypothetical protein
MKFGPGAFADPKACILFLAAFDKPLRQARFLVKWAW